MKRTPKVMYICRRRNMRGDGRLPKIENNTKWTDKIDIAGG